MPRIPFIGGAYKGRSTDINAQVCINLYPEIDQMEAKTVRALIGTPGMSEWLDLGSTVEVRGLHVVGSNLYAVGGNTLYKIDTTPTATTITGNLTLTIGRVIMRDNGTELMIIEPETEGHIYETVAGGNLTAIADADFPTPKGLAFQDGYFIITKDDTGEFYISTSYDGTGWDATEYATAESNPDNLLACLSDHGELWLFGKESVEVWTNTGAADFPFERIPGVFIQEGIDAPLSIAQIDNSVFWLSNLLTVIRVDGYSPVIVSTRHLEYIFASYSTTNDAFAYGYTQEGHSFYVLTFPTERKTWVYDAATKLWHQRRSYPTDNTGTQHRHRSNCYAFFNGKHLVGDFEDGKIYELDMATYTDAGNAIRRIRAAQVIHNDRKNIFYNKFEIDFESGVGITTGQGSDPQAMLDWSDDGGHTWGNEHWTDIGEMGKYGLRAIWRRLGRSRNRVFRVSISDPVKVVMIAAHLEAEIGAV